MRSRAAVVFGFLATIVACGSGFTLPPVTSGVVVQHTVGGHPAGAAEPRRLTSQQVQSVSNWFSQHSEGWSQSFVSYAPSLEIRLEHRDDVSVVNIVSPTFIVVYNRSGQFERKAGLQEVESLKSAIGDHGA